MGVFVSISLAQASNYVDPTRVLIEGIVRHRSRLNANSERIASRCYDFANRHCFLFFLGRLTDGGPRNNTPFPTVRLEDETISSFPSPGLFKQLCRPGS